MKQSSYIKWKKLLPVADLTSSFLILLFVYTGINKLIERETFAFVLSMSPLLRPLSSLISWVLPILELLVAVLLFFPLTRLKGLFASLALMSVFTLYLAYMLLFTSSRPCSCGGIISQLSWNQHVLFNIVAVLLCITGIVINIKIKKYEKSATLFSNSI